MKMFSDCLGECCLCACGDLCLAGHGDDYFSPASKEQIIERLDNGRYPSYTSMMKEYLRNIFGYDYDKQREITEFDRDTALEVLKALSKHMYPSNDLFGNKTLVIDRDKFEAVRKKFLG